MSEDKSDPIRPDGVDLNRPSVARVYDYYLGGTANWAVDRDFGDRVLSKFPLLRDIALSNRQLLNRVVRHLTKRGVRQFLDIGAGVPTAGNTHQVADETLIEAGATPDVRVVYVDNDPVAVAHANMLLNREGDASRQAVIEADLRNPDELWREAIDTQLLDPNEPVALLLIAVLHVHQPDADGNDIGPESVARFRDLLPRGSYLAISHITDEAVPEALSAKLAELKRMYDESSSSNAIWRTREQIAALLGDFEVINPGWTWTPDWHPEEGGPTTQPVAFHASNEAVVWTGVGLKP
ncbi:SAM-dependent methyltransferase [Amycolatopsis rubida]|uniref:O-Methyltransferase involved in polyketide biosynthesis n=1 Tax=Amycolatopsis rubida TaxID=112413 RepID=A0A1I5E4B7_9PSEU|nr:SAM-dependent methyltransferase [Amycolatopsis rubida]SFO06355.1 O-Methyltransferase involved in polyketide biosynthesis [Amycolatopsis rubida]